MNRVAAVSNRRGLMIIVGDYSRTARDVFCTPATRLAAVLRIWDVTYSCFLHHTKKAQQVCNPSVTAAGAVGSTDWHYTL